MKILFFFAFSLDADDFWPDTGPLSPEMRERTLILGSILLVTAALLLWAAFFRKPKRPHHRHSWGSQRDPIQGTKAIVAEAEHHRHSGRHRHHRRRRQQHRPRNPTLAETGGLPPYHIQEPPNPPLQ